MKYCCCQYILAFAIALTPFIARSQSYSNDYASFTYTGQREQAITSSAINAEHELLVAGNARNGRFVSMTDGWVAKLTPQGNVLWSKRYSFDNFNRVSIKAIESITGGGFVAIVNCGNQGDNSQITRSASLMIKGDMYGNVEWSKVITTEPITYFYGLKVLASGDYVAAGSSGSSLEQRRSPCHFLRVNPQGQLLWSTIISIDRYFFGYDPDGRVIELNNGNLLFASHTIERDYDRDLFLKAGFSFVVLNGATGIEAWKKIYTITGVALGVLNQVGHLEHIRQKSNGDLLFYASYSETIPIPNPGYRKIMEIQTNVSGVLQQVRSFYNNVPGCMIIDGDGNGLLLDDGVQPILLAIDDLGNTVQKVYGNNPLKQAPAAINTDGSNYYMFANDRESGRFIRYLRVGLAGAMPCEETPANIIDETLVNMLAEQPITSSVMSGTNALENAPVMATDYPLQTTTDCKMTCCDDIVGYAPPVESCSDSVYTLPNGYVAKDSGMYYIAYPLTSTCDSIVFHHVSFPRPPVFSLGADTCFISVDTIRLEAPPGYTTYTWNNVLTNTPVFISRQPGIYWLRVSNSCGNYTDSIEVYEKCEFDIFIPSAFTPNDDKLNDEFGIPPQNRNRLLFLTIYNRWGQVVFSTNSTARRWNGNYRGKPASAGVYIYHLRMETLDRKKIIERKGNVTLIR